MRGLVPVEAVAKELAIVGQHIRLNDADKHELAMRAWTVAVDETFEDSLVSAEEEKRLVALARQLELPPAEINKTEAFNRLVKGAVLRDLTEGKMPNRVSITGGLQFNLQKKEKIAWLFNSAEYHKMKTLRTYVGGSTGVSVRIAKGLYWRVGAFLGHTLSRDEMVYQGTGMMAVTQKHIYFSGPGKSFRVPYAKVVSFEPFSDGIGIHREGANAKPEFFKTGDGWFTYNLVMNLKELA